MGHTIVAENLGPITELEFSMSGPGVTVLKAPNGSGKSILLEGVQAAAKGAGRLPLRDFTKRGKIEAFGAAITIGGTCRHTGCFEVTHLEGRFDLASLVDPRIKDPEKADAARIKALVALTGVAASADLFRGHEAFEGFDQIVKTHSLQTDDLCEMARRIKSDYDAAARVFEDTMSREHGAADALRPRSELELTAESDQEVLAERFQQAQSMLTKLETEAVTADKQASKHTAAKARIEQIRSSGIEGKVADLREQLGRFDTQAGILRRNKDEAEELLRRLHAELAETLNNRRNCEERLKDAETQIETLEEQEEILRSLLVKRPSDKKIAMAKEVVAEAQRAVERGALIRQAKADEATAAIHRIRAKQAEEQSYKCRDAGRATDDVLSSSIKCSLLRVESDGTSARLVKATSRSKSTPYHNLSDGEKWSVAIEIGAGQVGEGGLLVISQVGWEGLDGKHRQHIHEEAKKRGVYILTAEATTDPGADSRIVPTAYAVGG